ncbi:hypothetical protein Q1695_003702 [Nippostrongylus brasiliensis]|nr:hypothetical protein Q1695_003702 [Nippostrongylus brasiliensis]
MFYHAYNGYLNHAFPLDELKPITCTEYSKAINRYIRKGDWFMWVTMTKGTVSLPIFQSLEAFWPGLLDLIEQANERSEEIFGSIKQRAKKATIAAMVPVVTAACQINVSKLTILNHASPKIPLLPDADASEMTRLTYRYIDLRTDRLQSWGDEEGVQWTLGQLRNLIADVAELRKERKVIAFPKSKECRDLMSKAPAAPTPDQLERYGVVMKNVAKEDDEAR